MKWFFLVLFFLFPRLVSASEEYSFSCEESNTGQKTCTLKANGFVDETLTLNLELKNLELLDISIIDGYQYTFQDSKIVFQAQKNADPLEATFFFAVREEEKVSEISVKPCFEENCLFVTSLEIPNKLGEVENPSAKDVPISFLFLGIVLLGIIFKKTYHHSSMYRL